MSFSKFSISVSPELDVTLSRLATERGEDRSRLIETLLRENPLIQQSIQAARATPSLKKGRDLQELLLLGRVARQAWERRLSSRELRIIES